MTRRIAQFAVAAAVAATAGFVAASCGSSPSTPTPVPSAPQQQVPQPGPVNTAPVIHSVTSAVARTEVDTDVTVTADVSDAETTNDKLVFTWSATAGQITGSGPTVTFRLPKDAVLTPVNVTVSLQVTENYTDAGVAKQNTATATSTPLLVHDSKQELGDMGVKFLVDLFGNSNVAPSACLVDFSDSCQGKSKEFGDITNNRANFHIYSANASVGVVTFAGPAATATNAEVDLPCEFHDHNFPSGKDGDSTGTRILTAVYQQDRWWLCESSFSGSCGSCVVIGGRRMTMEEFFMAGLKDR
jgi:hypothetical protein